MKKITLALLALMLGLMAVAQEGLPKDRSSLDNPPEGYVNGLFTVNAFGTQVYFSQGNLQYVDGEWRFAEHQWDYLGDNGQGSADENVSRDLFGWGTSGLNHGAVCYQPWSTSQTPGDYFAYGDASYDLSDESGQADWGANGIANGGNVEGLWRVPTREEWEWLFFGRTTASGLRFAKAKVNGVRGVILLPDEWMESYHALNNANSTGGRYKDNVVTATEWESDFEAHGAVFFPAAGYRFGERMWYPGQRGSYCSATACGSLHAWNMVFDETGLRASTSVSRRGNGFSVRLVATSTGLWYTDVTTGEVTDITSTTATASGTVTTEGGTIITAVGVCWSTSPDPTIEGEHTDEGALTGDFTSALTGLERNTTYYVRAYATDGEGDTMYGDVVEFTTLAELPSVTTAEVTEIDITTATAGGEVTDDGGTEVDECGVCWGTTAELTIDGDHVAAATPGTGTFTVALTGLTQNTTYYVCAYVTNSEGTVYGETVSFTTLRQPWSITATAEPTEGGAVTGAQTYFQGDECTLVATPSDGYAFVNWTEGVDETGAPNVVSTNATYTLEVTAAHTLVAHFELTRPQGTINGKFSVNADGDQVYFSQGNLQYIGSAATPYWKFAEHQWDYLGTTTNQNSQNQNVDRDLFAWSTSGYDHGANGYQPWSTSRTNSDYYAYGNESCNLNDETGKADWGYNAISNGGNTENQWFTLSYEEWKYVFNTRTTTSGIRYVKATVNSVNGVILLPDDWDASYYTLSNTNTDDASFSTNTISETEWATLEQHGAVFLPAAGYRYGTSVSSVGSYGDYWSASNSHSLSAWYVDFDGSNLYTDDYYYRYYGLSVRLVRSAQDSSFGISATASPTEGGEVSGAGTYEAGAGCTLTATPNEGYTFVNWTEGDKVVSTNAEYTFRVTGSRTLVAHFELAPTSPEGTINGKFSVNFEGDQVYFSKGNLQYIGSAATPYWKFADHQWDYLGTTTNQNGQNQNVDRDLFGWGTSHADHGGNCFLPWSTSTANSDYHAYGNENYSLNDQTGYADWGYNAISNGGNTENQWFTLSYEEWKYVFNTRTTTSGVRYAKAKVNSVNGVILLPDDWDASYYTLSNTNTDDASFSSNTITADDWNTLEQHGAVFLPAAGYRYGTSVSLVGSDGFYWSASYSNSDGAWDVDFSDDGLSTDYDSGRYFGFSVRLVLPLQEGPFGISVVADPPVGGTLSGARAYDFGTSCTLTATPAEGYTFVNWTEVVDDTGVTNVVSPNAEYTFRVTSSRLLIANFELTSP
jgi:hypothetical protein